MWQLWYKPSQCDSAWFVSIQIVDYARDYDLVPSVLWRCCLVSRKGIRTVKTEWWGTGVVMYWVKVQICLWPSWCHCHSLSQDFFYLPVLPFWCRLTRVVLDKIQEERKRLCVWLAFNASTLLVRRQEGYLTLALLNLLTLILMRPTGPIQCLKARGKMQTADLTCLGIGSG